jgi:hypothetical protein
VANLTEEQIQRRRYLAAAVGMARSGDPAKVAVARGIFATYDVGYCVVELGPPHRSVFR